MRPYNLRTVSIICDLTVYFAISLRNRDMWCIVLNISGQRLSLFVKSVTKYHDVWWWSANNRNAYFCNGIHRNDKKIRNCCCVPTFCADGGTWHMGDKVNEIRTNQMKMRVDHFFLNFLFIFLNGRKSLNWRWSYIFLYTFWVKGVGWRHTHTRDHARMLVERHNVTLA